jgi:hypothetical protein
MKFSPTVETSGKPRPVALKKRAAGSAVPAAVLKARMADVWYAGAGKKLLNPPLEKPLACWKEQ